jgi:cadmium resistance protein CadD (predicted permease)
MSSPRGLALTFALAVGLGALAILSGATGWLGLVPMGLGLYMLWSRWRAGPDDLPAAPPGTWLLVPAMFLGLTTECFSVMAAIFADSRPAYLRLGVAGALVSIGGFCLIALALMRVADRAAVISRSLEKIGPYAMIAAGLYVLLDTPTDPV